VGTCEGESERVCYNGGACVSERVWGGREGGRAMKDGGGWRWRMVGMEVGVGGRQMRELQYAMTLTCKGGVEAGSRMTGAGE
jgi:hypothetical protein